MKFVFHVFLVFILLAVTTVIVGILFWYKSSDSWANSQNLTDVDNMNEKCVWSQSAMEFYNLFVDSWVIFPWLSN